MRWEWIDIKWFVLDYLADSLDTFAKGMPLILFLTLTL